MIKKIPRGFSISSAAIAAKMKKHLNICGFSKDTAAIKKFGFFS